MDQSKDTNNESHNCRLDFRSRAMARSAYVFNVVGMMLIVVFLWLYATRLPRSSDDLINMVSAEVRFSKKEDVAIGGIRHIGLRRVANDLSTADQNNPDVRLVIILCYALGEESLESYVEKYPLDNDVPGFHDTSRFARSVLKNVADFKRLEKYP